MNELPSTDIPDLLCTLDVSCMQGQGSSLKGGTKDVLEMKTTVFTESDFKSL